MDVPEIERREFGIGSYEKKIETRHLSFRSSLELKNFLIENTPFYLSHSAAYYEFPSETPMERKGWLGADLIFDLDIHTTKKIVDARLLVDIKNSAITLVEEFLLREFGLSKKEIFYAFSGNRGFHVHARETHVKRLGKEERAEICDYVCGKGMDANIFFREVAVGRHKRLEGPRPDQKGYPGRFAREAIRILETQPELISRSLAKDEKERELLIGGIHRGLWSVIKEDVRKKLWAVLKNISNFVEVDGSVTQDTTRLIRVPNSIHGGSFLIAKQIADINMFQPYVHAVYPSKQHMTIKALENIDSMEFGGTTQERIEKGEKKTVPESYGLFLAAKGCVEPLMDW